MRRILVVRAGAIGDGLLTLPALAALRTRWPGAEITLVGPRKLLPFALAARLVDAGLPIEGEAGLALFGELPAVPPDWTVCDLAIVWLQRWEPVAERLRAWGCETVLGGPSLPSVDSTEHVANHLFSLLTALNIGPAMPNRPKLVPIEAAEAAGHWWQDRKLDGGGPVVAVHPGSGGPSKCWPAVRYADLIETLHGRGRGVLLLLGPAEEQSAGGWERLAANHHALAVASGLDLPVVAGLLARCAGYVGNDSGMTHLAAALGLPTLALFGPTDPACWAPVGPVVRVLRDPGWVRDEQGAAQGRWELTVQEVLVEVPPTPPRSTSPARR